MIARKASLNGSATDWLRVTRSACGYALVGVLALGTLGGVPVARAGEAPAKPAATAEDASKVTRADHQALTRYLHHHPRVARQLHKDPSLVNDQAFLAKHSGLQKLLTAHPELQAELKQNPGMLANHSTKSAPKPVAAPQAQPPASK